MRMYKLRAKVDIEDMSSSHFVGWTAEGPSGLSHLDPRGTMLGWRLVAPVTDAADWSDDDETAWQWARISECLAELGPDFAADSQFPHDVGMDMLGGIDFDKGCYVGQEVVSRMKHRGTARRRPVHVSGDGLTAGASVMCGEREAGTLGVVVNGEAVAILRLDRIADPEAATTNGHGRLACPASLGELPFGDSGGAGSD